MSEAALACAGQDEREARIAAFLAEHGWGDAERVPLAGDASFRRYDRLHRSGETAVLMDAPPPAEDVRPFVRIANLVRSAGLSAPAIWATDETAGLLLLEDFGDDTYTRLLDRGADPVPLYDLAIDVLVHLHARLSVSDCRDVPVYGDARALEEVSRLLDWHWPAMMGEPIDASRRASFLEAWRAVLPLRHRLGDGLALYDYHVDNLMLLPGRSGVAACGVLDFQTAFVAPLALDLASLLEDPRREVPPMLVERERERYLAAFPALDPDAFDVSYAVLAAQRNTRLAGQYVRLCVRDGKSAYLSFLPRTWRLLEDDLKHPALAPVRAWFDANLPGPARALPPLLASRALQG